MIYTMKLYFIFSRIFENTCSCCARFGLLVFMGIIISPIFNLEAKESQLTIALMAAYQSNPSLLAKRAGLRAADEQVPAAFSNWRPDVSLTADLGYVDSLNTNSSGTAREQWRNSQSWGIDVSQSLYRGGRTFLSIEKAENNILSERADLMDTEQTIFLEVISAFIDVFREQEVLKLKKNNESVLVRQLEATKDRFTVGEITRTDVNQAEARLAQARADRIKSKGDLKVFRATYLSVVGNPAPEIFSEVKMLTGLPKTKEEALNIAAVKSPKVISAEYKRLAAINSAEEVVGQLLPELKLTGSWDRAFEGSSEQGRIDTAKVSLGLTVPIYQKGAVYSSVRKARQEVSQKSFSVDVERRGAIKLVTKSWESLVSARAQVVSFKSQIEANITALEGVQREASVGSRTVLDVLDAEQEMLDARVAHIGARRDELVAAYELKAALGELTVKGMGLPVDLYDHRKHYREVRGKWVGSNSSGGKK